MRPTFSKTYPTVGHPPVVKFAECRVAFVTSTSGTQLHNMSDKLANTAPMRARREILRKHGKSALKRSYK